MADYGMQINIMSRYGIKNYAVAGVLSSMGTVSSGISPDEAIFLPYSTAEKYVFGSDIAPQITVVASDVGEVENV